MGVFIRDPGERRVVVARHRRSMRELEPAERNRKEDSAANLAEEHRHRKRLRSLAGTRNVEGLTLPDVKSEGLPAYVADLFTVDLYGSVSGRPSKPRHSSKDNSLRSLRKTITARATNETTHRTGGQRLRTVTAAAFAASLPCTPPRKAARKRKQALSSNRVDPEPPPCIEPLVRPFSPPRRRFPQRRLGSTLR